MDRIEEKLDRLLASVGGTRTEEPRNGSGRKEIKATAAARRKAEELGIDLSEVEGTGADGQITVEDVRQKGGR
ncbi:MAG: E3 binding domain-containing protein [Rubrobacteraceae bacterium]|nr:E3 binding domain-containing protein [Rubrobacteraceae bacterium]